MNETMEQKALRIAEAYRVSNNAYAFNDSMVIDFARRLLAETGQEPVGKVIGRHPDWPAVEWKADLNLPFGTMLYASPQLPPDHVAVPREPTEAMIHAGLIILEGDGALTSVSEIYEAMLAAAHEEKP